MFITSPCLLVCVRVSVSLNILQVPKLIFMKPGIYIVPPETI